MDVAVCGWYGDMNRRWTETDLAAGGWRRWWRVGGLLEE